jgi:hypothetical protein
MVLGTMTKQRGGVLMSLPQMAVVVANPVFAYFRSR